MTTETSTERRRHVRKRLSCTTNVYLTETGASLGHIFDVSKEGFMLLGPEKLPASAKLNLTMELPELDKTRSITMSAVCVWSQPSSFSEDFGSGFNIEEISDQDQVALNYFIRDF